MWDRKPRGTLKREKIREDVTQETNAITVHNPAAEEGEVEI